MYQRIAPESRRGWSLARTRARSCMVAVDSNSWKQVATGPHTCSVGGHGKSALPDLRPAQVPSQSFYHFV
jgi:hypothetical protein